MKTLTLTDFYMTTNEIIERTVFCPSIPRYMESSLSMAAILTRNVGEIFYNEVWCDVGTYCDYADSATDFEMEAYFASHTTNTLDHIDDVPEPINVHDQDVWLACVADDGDVCDEYAVYRDDFNEQLYG